MTGQNRLRAPAAAVAAILLCTTAGSAASKRATAERYYHSAHQLYQDLKLVPPLEMGLQQFELVAGALQKVHRTDPSSGYCDDALLQLAEVYQQMADRFDDAKYRDKAIATYEFLARDYPQSKHRQQAQTLAASLKAGGNQLAAAGRQQTTAAHKAPVAAAAAVADAALSDSAHAAGDLINPPTPLEPGRTTAISEIRHHSYDDGTRIVLHMDGKTPLKYNRLKGPERLYIDLFGSRVSDHLIKGKKVEINDQLLSTARLAQNRNNKARMVLDVRRGVSFDAFWLENPGRLVIDVRAAGTQRAPRTLAALDPTQEIPASPRAADATEAGRLSLTRALGLKLDRILIDAGHGGHDTGSIGPGGLREKDVVLDIAQRLGKLVQERLGAEVIQTRASDTFVPLEERTKIANERGADLMISIHCNSAPSSKVRGIETYYLNFTSDEWELSVASLENAAASRSIHELADLVSKIALEEKIEESREFATKVQDRLHAGVSKHSSAIRNRGIRKAPFVVLIGAEMPAVLAEIAFISNKTDEAFLRKSSFRQEVAQHLFDGISAYAASLGVVTMRRSLSPGSAQRD